MKKRIGLIIAIILLSAVSLALADVPLDAAHFPDAAFLECAGNFDINPKDGVLSDSELLAVEKIECENKDIADMTGLQYFTNLKDLQAAHNRISVIDVSGNKKLEILSVWENQIPGIDLSANKKIRELRISRNPIFAVDVSGMPDLEYLSLNRTSITTLNLKNNPKLTDLYLSYINLSSLDISSQRLLCRLWMMDTRVPQLDITSCPTLMELTKQYFTEYNETNNIWGNTESGPSLIIPKDQNINTGNPSYENPDAPSPDGTLKVGEEKVMEVVYMSEFPWKDNEYFRTDSTDASIANITTIKQYMQASGFEFKYTFTITVRGNSVGTATIKILAPKGTNVVWEQEVTVYDPSVPLYCTVSVTGDGNGTAVASPAYGRPGTKVTLSATPNEGWQFREWKVISGTVDIESNVLFIGNENLEILAVFEKTSGTDVPEQPEGPEDPASITVDGLTFQVNDDGKTAVFTGPENKDAASLTIPASADGFKVTEIAANACKGMKKLKKVTIGKNVKTVGENAFCGCAKLRTVSGGAGIVTIGDGAFRKCTALTAIILNKKVTKIGKNAFNGCKKLKTVTVKTEKLKKDAIGKNCFKGIYAKATFKCPKKMLKKYKSWLKNPGGAPKTAKFK